MTWTSDELARIGAAEELNVAARRHDGTLRETTTIWVVRHGDDVQVRSVNGPTASWFDGTQARHEGRIRAGGVEKDVSFVDADCAFDAQIDTEHRAKYGRYAASIINHITSTQARSTTVRLVPLAQSHDTGEMQ